MFFLSFFFLLSSFLMKVQKKVKTVQTNMAAYVVWAINFKSEVRSGLNGYLEATVASKNLILRLMEVLNLLTTNCWAPIDGKSYSNSKLINPQFFTTSPKILNNVSKYPQKSLKNQILCVTRRSVRSEPCFACPLW